jgi:hypothetical protein
MQQKGRSNIISSTNQAHAVDVIKEMLNETAHLQIDQTAAVVRKAIPSFGIPVSVPPPPPLIFYVVQLFIYLYLFVDTAVT